MDRVAIFRVVVRVGTAVCRVVVLVAGGLVVRVGCRVVVLTVVLVGGILTVVVRGVL